MEIILEKPVAIVYECRDIGYGVESGQVEGVFTGEIDTLGKYTFQPSDGRDKLYLFADEILACGPIRLSTSIM